MCINGTVGFNKSNDQISNIKALPTVIDFIFYFPLLSHLIHASYAHVAYNIALVVSPFEATRIKKMNQNILLDVCRFDCVYSS